MKFVASALFANALILLSPSGGVAEYRVFVLKIMKKSTDPQIAQDFRLVESTLDPEQYRMYYPVANDEEVTYTETWRCFGSTGNFKPHCPNPKAQIATPEGSTP